MTPQHILFTSQFVILFLDKIVLLSSCQSVDLLIQHQGLTRSLDKVIDDRVVINS